MYLYHCQDSVNRWMGDVLSGEKAVCVCVLTRNMEKLTDE